MWLTNLGRFLNREQQAAVAIKAEEERLKQHVAECNTLLQGKRIVLYVGRPLLYFDPAWVLELFSLYGITLAGIVVMDDVLSNDQRADLYEELKKQTTIPCCSLAESKVIVEMADIVVTTHELEDVGKRQLFLPLLPLAGVGGMITLMTKLVRLAQRHDRRGGIVYV